MFKPIRSFDLFDQSVELYLQKKTSHSTTIGGLVSVALIILISLLGISYIREMVNHTNPQSLIQEVLQTTVPFEQLDFRNFTFTFGLQNAQTFQTWLNESLAQVTFWQVHKYSTIDQYGQSQVNFDKIQIPIKPCTPELIGVSELKQYFLKNDIQTQYCVDFEKVEHIYLEGQFDTDSFQYLEVNIGNCRNSSVKSGKPICAPQEEIDLALNLSIFAFQFNDLGMDVQNFYNPHKIVGKDIYTSVSNQIFKHIDLYLQPVITQTDVGYFSQTLEYKQGLKYNSYTEKMDFVKLENMFFRMMFRLDNKNWISQRQYIKLTDIVGKIGGIWQVLFFVCLVIIRKINLFSQKLLLLNQIFDFEQDQNDINKNNINIKLEIERIQMRNYFEIKKNKILLIWKDYIRIFLNYFRCSKVKGHKYQQIKFATKKIEQSLDVANIINKLNEVDKLKNILLTYEQIQLFDYIDKPKIAFDPEKQLINDQDYRWSILRKSKQDRENLGMLASKSLKVLLNQQDRISKNLVQMLNQDFMRFAKQQNLQRFSISREEESNLGVNIDERRIEDQNINLSNYPILFSPLRLTKPLSK